MSIQTNTPAADNRVIEYAFDYNNLFPAADPKPFVLRVDRDQGEVSIVDRDGVGPGSAGQLIARQSATDSFLTTGARLIAFADSAMAIYTGIPALP